jgi:hypothetical protein
MDGDELKKAIRDGCETYQPRKPGRAKAINNLIRSVNAAEPRRLPPTHGDTILAVTPDGKEFVCAMEVDELLSEAEGRVIADASMRMGIDIQYGPASDGLTCDEGDGCPRPVPAYSSEELDRLRQVESEALTNATKITALREQVATYERITDKLAESNVALNLENTQLREAVKVLGAELKAWRDAPHTDHVLSSYWSDLPVMEKLIISAGSDVNNNPIAAEAARGER